MIVQLLMLMISFSLHAPVAMHSMDTINPYDVLDRNTLDASELNPALQNSKVQMSKQPPVMNNSFKQPIVVGPDFFSMHSPGVEGFDFGPFTHSDSSHVHNFVVEKQPKTMSNVSQPDIIAPENKISDITQVTGVDGSVQSYSIKTVMSTKKGMLKSKPVETLEISSVDDQGNPVKISIPTGDYKAQLKVAKNVDKVTGQVIDDMTSKFVANADLFTALQKSPEYAAFRSQVKEKLLKPNLATQISSNLQNAITLLLNMDLGKIAKAVGKAPGQVVGKIAKNTPVGIRTKNIDEQYQAYLRTLPENQQLKARQQWAGDPALSNQELLQSRQSLLEEWGQKKQRTVYTLDDALSELKAVLQATYNKYFTA